MSIEIIDLFAGPGGLGEGFSAFASKKNHSPFKVKISIEKEKFAHETLVLRAFYRQFSKTPKEYYQYLRSEISKKYLFEQFPVEIKKAQAEVYQVELGDKKYPHDEVIKRIKSQINNPKESIVIGGPPCQAYSLAARSKMSKNNNFENDPRHTLYREYLKIIADIKPAAFIMENVKGILSSKLNGEYIFDRILADTRTPLKIKKPHKKTFNNSETYTIYSLSTAKPPKELKKTDFLIKCEDYGIPQCRHRVILLAVRNDLKLKHAPTILHPKKKQTNIFDVLSDLPKIRSGLSKKGDDNMLSWKKNILRKFKNAKVYNNLTRGAEFISIKKVISKPKAFSSWFYDKKIGGVLNHSARSHIASDLHRYHYSANFGLKYNISPKLGDFPKGLLPNHKNVKKALKSKSLFSDRFRVQLANKPATTITSHISKDGHYFIHYDPKQCRSLTVREAMRIQTFPDNYKFEGPRTSQYQQAGNAVPPLLARDIAKIVFNLLKSNGTDS